MKVLIDTNVFIDFLQDRQPFANESREVIFQALNYEGYVAASNITDIYYLQYRQAHNKKKTKKDISDLLNIFEIIDTTGVDCRNALRSNMDDFEDAVLVESAKRNDIYCIVTRNVKDFKNSNVTVYTPAEFLELLRTKGIKETT